MHGYAGVPYSTQFRKELDLRCLIFVAPLLEPNKKTSRRQDLGLSIDSMVPFICGTDLHSGSLSIETGG